MTDTASLITRVKNEGVAEATTELDNFAASAAKADTASQKTSAGFGNFRNSAQQVGFQVQDMVVQLQSGTSAFVALGQQGSQLAGAFGPGGAVLGAVIALASAVGGVLYKSMGDAEISSKDLADAQQTVADMLTLTTEGTYETSDAFDKFTASGATAAEQTAMLDKTLGALQVTLDNTKQKVIELGKETQQTGFFTNLMVSYMAQAGQAAQGVSMAMDATAEKLGVTRKEFDALTKAQNDFRKNATPENMNKLATVSDQLRQKYGAQNKEIVRLNETYQQANKQYRDNIAQQQAAANAAAESQKKIEEREKKEAARIAAAEARDKKRAAAQAKREQDAAARQAKAIQSKADADAKAAQTFMDGVNRQNSDELKAIDAQEQQKLDKLQSFREQGAISDADYEATKTQIMLDADQARQDELDKREEDRRKKKEKGDDFMTQIMGQNATELELLDIQEKQKQEITEKYREQGLISEQQYQDAMLAIADATNKKRREEYANVLGQTTDDLKTSLGEGSKAYKAFAIANAVMSTYTAAVNAYASASAIPVVGWVLGPVAAAAAIAAGLANVGKIRSAREQGGQISMNQAFVGGERGKPEVIMPAGASRVRTADQMRQIMGENPGNSGDGGVTIVNNTSAPIGSARTERDDEGRLRIIISEQMAAETMNSNSNFSKARRSTRGRPGFA